jgi:hypothetical protein
LQGKDRKVSKKADKVPLVEEAAGDILQTFETVSRDALVRLNSAPVHGTDVLASVNALTLVRGLNAIDDLIQAERDSLLILSREPAIARVRTKDQNGAESTVFICRTTPPSNSSTYASNRSALGRLAALPVGHQLPVGSRILTVLEKEKLRPTLKAELWDSENTEFEALDFGVFTVEYLRPFLTSTTSVQETADFLSRLLADEQFKTNIVEGKRRLVIQKMSPRDQPILDQYQDEIFRLPLRKRLFILGPAGTGKTTTLIRRLGQKRDTAYLEPEEKDLVEAINLTPVCSPKCSIGSRRTKMPRAVPSYKRGGSMKRRSDGEDWIMGPSLNRFCARWNLESAVVPGRFALEPDRKRQALLANRTHGHGWWWDRPWNWQRNDNAAVRPVATRPICDCGFWWPSLNTSAILRLRWS